MKDPPDPTFSRLWLYSAAFVTVLRVFHPIAPGYDLGLQFEAAQNLVAGHGLSLYQHSTPNLTDPASLVTLTHFPSGYSLVAAALIAFHLSVGSIIKVTGAAATMLGWWGWGRLAEPFFREGLTRSVGWNRAGRSIAISMPLFFSPAWGGTDIFLWAAVPWVLLCVVEAPVEGKGRRSWLDGLSGILCGLCVLMRYEGLFLAVYVAALILWQSRLRPSVLTRRLGGFLLGLLPAISLQMYVDYFLANSVAKPGGLSFSVTPGGAVRRLFDGISFLYNVNYAWTYWIPSAASRLFLPRPPVAWPWQLGLTLMSVILLIMAAQAYGFHRSIPSRDPRIATLGFVVAIPTMLLACMMFGRYNYVSDQRYYLSILPVSVFVAYSVAAMIHIPQGKSADKVLQLAYRMYVAGYIATTVLYVMFLLTPGHIGNSQREKLMASELHKWPSMALTDELSPARRLVMQLLKEQPDALLLTSKAGLFYWDPAVDRSKLYELNCGALRATYLSGPARFVIFTHDKGEPRELWYYGGNGINGDVFRADCFERVPNLTMLQRFQDEGVKVLEARIGPDQQISLKP